MCIHKLGLGLISHLKDLGMTIPAWIKLLTQQHHLGLLPISLLNEVSIAQCWKAKLRSYQLCYTATMPVRKVHLFLLWDLILTFFDQYQTWMEFNAMSLRGHVVRQINT